MDSIDVGWCGNHCEEIGPLWLTWRSAGSCLRYTESMAEWAEELGMNPSKSNSSSWYAFESDTNLQAAQLEADYCLVGC